MLSTLSGYENAQMTRGKLDFDMIGWYFRTHLTGSPLKQYFGSDQQVPYLNSGIVVKVLNRQ